MPKSFRRYQEVLIKPTSSRTSVSGKPLVFYITVQEKSLGILCTQVNEEGKERALLIKSHFG